MEAALLSLTIPFAAGLGLLLVRHFSALSVILASLASLVAAGFSLVAVVEEGAFFLAIGGWAPPLGIQMELTPLRALLLIFTALIHLLVALYAARSRSPMDAAYWPLSCFLHSALAAIWLASDLFNFYVTLEFLTLTAVAMVSLAGHKAYRPALNYLLLSLAASLFYLMGVALIYGLYGRLDIAGLQSLVTSDSTTLVALVLMTLGLMVKAAMWPLHSWLPAAHSAAPAAVSALLSALVVKGPLFILWIIWTELASANHAVQVGLWLSAAGLAALVSGGWSALRAPYLKTLVAYSTVAQLGYALLAMGLLMYWQQAELQAALWLFVLAHGLAKVTMFLTAGEMLNTLGTQRVAGLKGASQSMPVAMFGFAVAGGSLIGLPPSGGFLAKWLLLQPLLLEPQRWIWALGVLLGTLVSAAYVFRVVALAFNRAEPNRPVQRPDRISQWLTLLPALLVWSMALVAGNLAGWLSGVPA